MKAQRPMIVLIALIFSFLIPYRAMAENEMAWIKDGYKDCKVTRYENGKFKEFEASLNTGLYPGDKIYKKDNIKNVRFETLPYIEVKIKDNSTAIIINNAPKDKKSIFAKIAEYFGLVKTKYKEKRATSRGGFGPEAVSLENATLIAGQTIYFDDYFKGKTIVFKELNGNEVFHKTFTDDLSLIPGNAGLQQGKIYIREIKNGERTDYRSTIRVLEKQDEETVKNTLVKIDSEKISAEEKIIKKAAYLQFISDLYPGQVDLYWYSYQLIYKTEIKEEGLLDLYEILIGSCMEHKNGGISAVDFALLNNRAGCLVTVHLTRALETSFVPPDFPFTDYDEFSLYFQVNFEGYCAVLHDSGNQVDLAFPVDHTGHQVKPGPGYRSCTYRFDDKPGIECYIFILSDKPLEEIEQYGKLSSDPASPWAVAKPNPGQSRLLKALLQRVKIQEKKITLEMMGSKSFARVPGASVKGITWFRAALEN